MLEGIRFLNHVLALYPLLMTIVVIVNMEPERQVGFQNKDGTERTFQYEMPRETVQKRGIICIAFYALINFTILNLCLLFISVSC